MSKADLKNAPKGFRKSTPGSATQMHRSDPQRVFILNWLFTYKRDFIAGDVLAGSIVAIMLLPQAIAYAMLAGLPPQAGLYAALVPLVLYPLFGTSTTLAVGPVAILSLLVGATLAPIAIPGSPEYVFLALTLTLMSGGFLILAGLFRLGQFTNFISRPVIAGFTTAAALIIGFSQIKHVLGIDLPRTSFIPSILSKVADNLGSINFTTVLIGSGSIALLMASNLLRAALVRAGLSLTVADLMSKSMPLVVVVGGTLLSWLSGLDSHSGVKIVGSIPPGLPHLTNPIPDLATLKQLIGPAAIIAIIGYVQSLAAAKSLGAKRREVIDPNAELLGLGMANIGAAFTGGFPVTGGLSRSVVNFMAGARTQGAAIFTALLIAIALIFLAPALYHLPKAILAAIILVAIASLVDFKPFFTAWHYNRADGLAFGLTFLAVLAIGVERGILLGIVTSIGMYLWKTSRPHYAVLGRIEGTEHFRNINRHFVNFNDDTLILRLDENLYFANTTWLENRLLTEVARRKSVKQVVLNLNSVSYIDSSALEALESSILNLRASGVTLHFAGIKGPVLDRLAQTELIDLLSPGGIFLTTHDAVTFLHSHKDRPLPDTQQDKNAWEKAKIDNNIKDVEQFLKDNPASLFAGHARRKLLQLADDNGLERAQQKHTIEAYQTYLQQGSHNRKNKLAARAALRDLKNPTRLDPFTKNLVVLYTLGLIGAALLYWFDMKSVMQKAMDKKNAADIALEQPMPVDPKSASISQLQQRLKILGYDPGPITGRMSNKTRSALSSYIKQTDDNINRLNQLLRDIEPDSATTGTSKR